MIEIRSVNCSINNGKENKTMKKLQCKMCGGTIEFKSGEKSGVCDSCGAICSIEETKNTNISNIYRDKRTNKNNFSETDIRRYKMAREAKTEGNSRMAEEFYREIKAIYEHDWEGLFYYEYFKSINNDCLTNLIDSLDRTFYFIDKSDKTTNEKYSITEEIISEIDKLCDSIIDKAKATYNKDNNIAKLCDKNESVAALQKTMADILKKYFAEKFSDIIATYLKSSEENIYAMARNAKSENNEKLALKFYQEIEEKHPQDLEAVFYSDYFSSKCYGQGMHSLDDVFRLINESDKDSETKWSIAKEIMVEIDELCEFHLKGPLTIFEKASGVRSKRKIADIARMQREMADLLEKYFPEKSSDKVIFYLKSYVQILSQFDINDPEVSLEFSKLKDIENRLKKLEPEYKPTVHKKEEPLQTKTSKVWIVGTILAFVEPLIAISLMFPLSDRFGDTGVHISIGTAVVAPFITVMITGIINKINEKKKQQDGSKKDNTETNNKSTNLENSNSNENTKKKRKVGIICLSIITGIVILIVVISSFGNKINSDLVGTWRSEENSSVSITFKNNGDMIVRSSSAVDDGLSYEIDGDTVTVTFANNDTETYGFVVEGNTLIFGEKYYTKVQ